MWAGVITSEPTPLQKLAKHLFAICVANSASCERLFSLFGIILTRRRSRHDWTRRAAHAPTRSKSQARQHREALEAQTHFAWSARVWQQYVGCQSPWQVVAPGPMVTAVTMQHLEPQTRWRRKDDHSHLSRPSQIALLSPLTYHPSV